MLTGTNSRSASATVSGVAPSVPSSYGVAPTTTCSGTTVMPWAAARSVGERGGRVGDDDGPGHGSAGYWQVTPPRTVLGFGDAADEDDD